MKININGETREISAETLASALDELGYGEAVVATAVNGEFVGKDKRPATLLNPDDTVEILAPMQGG